MQAENLGRRSGYMVRIERGPRMWEASEIELRSNKERTEGGLSLIRSCKPLVHTLEGRRKHAAQNCQPRPGHKATRQGNLSFVKWILLGWILGFERRGVRIDSAVGFCHLEEESPQLKVSTTGEGGLSPF